MKHKEKQLTHGNYGHTLNNIQAFSKDGDWLVYDTRNDDTKIGSTGSIEIVHTRTGEVKKIYATKNQSEYGPGVGAAAFSPVEDKVVFIQGIRNANAVRPYSLTRRTGVAVDLARPNVPIYLDARDVTPPFTPGALRGGTHAHSWSGDGKLLSFTYNDYVIEQAAKKDSSLADLRMVAVMVPGRVDVPEDASLENNSGLMFAAVVTWVTEHPAAGTDQIAKAFDECWIGKSGYVNAAGKALRYAIAFQGNVVNAAGETVTELFVVDLPEDMSALKKGDLLAGTMTRRPGVPTGIQQRRITFTAHGVEGPRHWIRSAPDGKELYFLAKDAKQHVQVFAVSPNGGAIRQVSFNDFSVAGQVNVSPDGKYLAYAADNSIYVTSVSNGKTHVVTAKFADADKPVGAPAWSPDGKRIAYNRYVKSNGGSFLQVFLIEL
ncbi:MAG: DUF3748 domain-containing protein [Pedobacter sp.]|nr:MAG: DUF3748 domain-containing protein [Pedobacter sp.]